MKRSAVLLVVFALLPVRITHAQDVGTIAGLITAAETGAPLPGTNVTVVGTARSVTTAADGRYVLTGAPPGTYRVRARLIGYVLGEASVTVVLGQTVTADFQLVAQAIELQEVVTVGYGTQRRRDITGSVASIQPERLERLPHTNAFQALQGAVPGLSITTEGGGAEGGDLGLLIRGRNSITASNRPLIVIDGIPFNGSISEVNPNDIASIEVLKDASAAAIYGSRGSNGVLLLTTKTGRDKPSFSYDGYVGAQQIANRLRLMTGPEFAEFKCQRLNGGQDCASVLTPTERENLAAGRYTDWLDVAMRTGFQQQHSLSVRGDAGGMKYYLAGSALDVRGLAKNDKFRRYAIRLNLDHKVNSWMRLGSSTHMSYTDRSGLPASFVDALHQNPLTNPYEEDGKTLTVTPWPEDPFFENPLQGLVVIDNDLTRRIFTSNFLEVDLPFLKGLSYRFNGGIDFANADWGRYYGRNTRTGLNYGGYALRRNTNRFDWTAENLLRYSGNFGAHSVDLTTLYSAQKYTLEKDSLNSRDFPNDVLTYYQMDVGSLIQPVADLDESGLVSQMGRLNYGYAGRYLLTLTVRRDGFSGFGANYKYGTFPSLALGWNLAEETFWPFRESIDALKLRISYGKNGNQAVGPYRTLARMSENSYLRGEGTKPGYIPSTLGNPDLKWETTTSLNFGTDFSLLSGRLSGSLDVYFSRTSDLLLNRLISSVHGVSRVLQNLGEVRNRGVELHLSTRNIDTPEFSWSTDLNVATNRDEIVDLYGDGLDDAGNQWFIGQPIDVNYGYAFGGIWQEGDDIANSAQRNARPGDARVLDINGDGRITSDDRTFIGSANPSYVGGLTNTLRYKRVSLSFFLRTVLGITRRNGMLETDELVMDQVRRNTVKLDYWTPQNLSTRIPANREGSNPYDVGYYQDASFVRLRDVTLGFDVPESLTKRWRLQTLHFYVSGRNLWTLKQWTGLDPEFSSQRGIPLERVLISGVRVRL